MIDVHAHFAEEEYSFPEEWEKITSCGVSTVILGSDTLLHSQMHRDFCENYEGAYFCAGVHPADAESVTEQSLQELSALAKHAKCVAIGEIGLDYHYPDTNKRAQREAFVSQILLAEKLGLPLQIHSRDCASDTLSILTEMKAYLSRGFLLHCYSHGREMMDNFLDLGAYFSFGGVVCFKNAKKVVESASYCPQERILTETDSPYLSPFRGEKNSPQNIPVILQKLAEIKGVSADFLETQIEENAKRLFPKLKKR